MESSMKSPFNAEQKMRVGPSDTVYRYRFQTAPMLLRLSAVVVSDSGKRHHKRCQVCAGKVNASEPSMRRRKGKTMSEPMSSIVIGISMGGTCLLPMRHPAHRRHELGTGFCLEQENLSSRCKGKTSSSRYCKRESTEAWHGGGTPRSSEEVPVMGMERRGCIIRPTRSGEKLLMQEVPKEYRQNNWARTVQPY